MAMLYELLLLISLFSSFSYAEDSKQVDWNKMETQFYSDLKVTQGNHTEAELEQALGYMLLEKYNQWQRAAIHYKKAVKLDPTLFNSWYNLGLIYIDKEEGNEYFRHAIKSNPNFLPPYYWLAYNYCRVGKNKKAIPIFEKYVEIATKAGDTEEFGRIKSARELLKELYSGKEGSELREIRDLGAVTPPQ